MDQPTVIFALNSDDERLLRSLGISSGVYRNVRLSQKETHYFTTSGSFIFSMMSLYGIAKYHEENGRRFGSGEYANVLDYLILKKWRNCLEDHVVKSLEEEILWRREESRRINTADEININDENSDYDDENTDGDELYIEEMHADGVTVYKKEDYDYYSHKKWGDFLEPLVPLGDIENLFKQTLPKAYGALKQKNAKNRGRRT